MYAVFPNQRLRINLFSIPAFALLFWLEGMLPAALLILAALLHESGHFIALRYWRVPIRRLDLEPMGALIVYDDSLCPLHVSVWISFAGAAMNLLVMAVTVSFACKNPYFLFFALANGFLAVLNLLPWEKLDGGKLLLSLLLLRYSPDVSERVCRVASCISLLFVILLLLAIGSASSFPLWSILLSAMLLAQAIV